METIVLTFLISGLTVIFTIDTVQKRRRFLSDGK
jgi:hypothetical protein